MTLHSWKKLRRQCEIRNPWWTYRNDQVLLPSGSSGEYHYVHVVGSSMIIPRREDGRMILVNQYRYLAGRESLEFPCGSVKEGSTYEETAHLELAEETGFAADGVSLAGEFNPYNGVTDEICRVFLARHLHPVTIKRDETEEFEYEFLLPDEFDTYVQSGKIWDGMTLAAWALVKHLVIR